MCATGSVRLLGSYILVNPWVDKLGHQDRRHRATRALEMPRGGEAGDMFDEIVGLDDSLVRRGYDAGVRIGNAQGEEEGLQLGRLKGAEVGVRLAVYGGRLEALEVLARKHPGVFAKRSVRARAPRPQCVATLSLCGSRANLAQGDWRDGAAEVGARAGRA
jgi:hypothetical protein